MRKGYKISIILLVGLFVLPVLYILLSFIGEQIKPLVPAYLHFLFDRLATIIVGLYVILSVYFYRKKNCTKDKRVAAQLQGSNVFKLFGKVMCCILFFPFVIIFGIFISLLFWTGKKY